MVDFNAAGETTPVFHVPLFDNCKTDLGMRTEEKEEERVKLKFSARS